MPIYKQANSKNWLIEFTIDGQRFRRSSGTTNKRTAQQLEQKWRQEHQEHRHKLKPAPQISLEDAIERFIRLNVNQRQCRQRTKDAEIYALRRMCVELGPSIKLGRLDAGKITLWRESMLSKGLTTTTVNRYLATLKSLLNTASRDWGVLDLPPTIKLLPQRN